MTIGASAAETFWTEFLRQLARRGLRGVKLVISDDHSGLTKAIRRALPFLRRCDFDAALLSAMRTIDDTATAEHARHVIEIFDAAYRSAESGQAQELRTSF